MTSYIVSWKIDIDADDPVQAAQLAQSMLQGCPEDWVYEVMDCETKETIKVDLEYEHLEDSND